MLTVVANIMSADVTLDTDGRDFNKILIYFEINENYPGSKMTISGRPEIGLEDVPWTLAAHCIDILRTSVDPKIFKTLLKKLIFIKVLDNHLYTKKA